MTTGVDLVNRAATWIGQRYSTDPGRDDPSSTHKDCSGLIAAAYLAETGTPLGANVSVTIYALAARQGLAISREEAFGIAGACLLIPDDPMQGWGPNGHIGFSDGQGGTVEATPPRVTRLPNWYQPWGPAACLLPGIDYSNAGQGGAQPSTRKGQHMIYVDVEARVALAMEGPVIVAEFNGPPNQYGIPQDAMDYAGSDIPLRVVPGLVLAKLRKADEIALTPPVVTTVPGDCPPLTSYTAQELVEALATVIG